MGKSYLIKYLTKVGGAAAGVAVGSFFFWLAARHTSFADIRAIADSANSSWIALGVALFGADLTIRIVRWRHIIGHRETIEFFKVARGMMAGYALNILLPARLGELFRADYTSRLSGVDRGTLLASVFVERIIDLVIVVGIFVVGLSITGVRDIGLDNILFGAVAVLICCSALIWLMLSDAASRVLNRTLALAYLSGLPEALIGRVSSLFASFVNLLKFVATRRFLETLALSVPIWSLELLALWAICRAVGLTGSLGELLVLLGSASLSTLIPTAPGFLGTYQFAFVVALRNFGVPDPLALAAATATQIFLMFLFAVIGLIVWAAAPVWLSFQTTVGAGRTAG